MIHPDYPTPSQIDQWCDKLLGEVDATDYQAQAAAAPERPGEVRARHTSGQFIAFDVRSSAERFYAYFQPVYSGGPAPLLLHVPGYGGELSMHPELVFDGFNVLHVNPRGYYTPHGPDNSKLLNGAWPVLPETVISLGERGYVDWYRDVLIALRWAQAQTCVQTGRVGLFGTSQGGGAALILASLARGRGVKAVAADVPFLTHFPMMWGMKERGAYSLAFSGLDDLQKNDRAKLSQAWRALGYTDTMCHAYRLNLPVLLTAGGADAVCPPCSIKALFDVLPGTRSYTELTDQTHTYTVPFLALARAWFGLHV
jgi:cephalosporin-C deacetylase-like acetyl esterase